MFVIVGIVLVFACVLGGYVAMGGKLGVLWQPFEVVIIVGAAIGALIVGNPKSVLSKIGKGFGKAMKGPPYKKHDYIEFLSVQYQVFKMARSKGMFTLESHVESPDESDLFNQLPGFHDNHHAVAFVCDYLRMMSLVSEFPHEMEALMDEEIETHPHETTASQVRFSLWRTLCQLLESSPRRSALSRPWDRLPSRPKYLAS